MPAKRPTPPSRTPVTPAHRAMPDGVSAAQARAPQEVRILGGRFKRTPLPVPIWPGLRPTPARVRETLFNWLGQDLAGWRVLDAFAGSGALGLEAASRGAESVVLVEKEPTLARHLSATVTRLQMRGVTVQLADALVWMGRQASGVPPIAPFDLVLLDPPFDAGLFEAALRAARACTVPGGWVYLESPHAWQPATAFVEGGPPSLPPGFRLHRAGRAGQVHFQLLQCECVPPA